MCTILSAYKYGINANLFLVINLLFELCRSFGSGCCCCFSLFFAFASTFRDCTYCWLVFFAFVVHLAFMCDTVPCCLCDVVVCVIQAYSIKCVLLTFVSSFTFQFRLLNSCSLVSYFVFLPNSVLLYLQTHFFSGFPLILIQWNCQAIYGDVFSLCSSYALWVVCCAVSRNTLRLLNMPKSFFLSIALGCFCRSAGSKCVCAQHETLCSFICVGCVYINKASSVEFVCVCFFCIRRFFFVPLCHLGFSFRKSKDKITHLFWLEQKLGFNDAADTQWVKSSRIG